jgi:anti-anti-sigma regulatory factor
VITGYPAAAGPTLDGTTHPLRALGAGVAFRVSSPRQVDLVASLQILVAPHVGFVWSRNASPTEIHSPIARAADQVDLIRAPTERGMTAADREDQAVGYQAHGSVAVIALPARVEAVSVLALRSRSERALVTGSRAIAIDLRATDHIDTPTLSELGASLHSISRHKPKLAVVGADPRVVWALEQCGVEGLQLHRTMRGALAHLRGGRLRAGTRWREGHGPRRPGRRRSPEP